MAITMAMTTKVGNLTMTKETLIRILQDIRADICNNNLEYKMGNDVEKVHDAYIVIVPVCGCKVNKIEKTKLVVVKYWNTNNELCSLNASYMTVYRQMPEVLYT